METVSKLECPICNNRFTVEGCFQPRILECGHSFCTNCISKSEINEIRCSYCSHITYLGVLGAYALPVNETLIELLCSSLKKEKSVKEKDLGTLSSKQKLKYDHKVCSITVWNIGIWLYCIFICMFAYWHICKYRVHSTVCNSMYIRNLLVVIICLYHIQS